MIPMPLDEAIQVYVVAQGPSFACGPITRTNTSLDCAVKFCFSKDHNNFWSVEAKIRHNLRTHSAVEIEKIDDDLYDEAVLMFELRRAEIENDHKKATGLACYLKYRKT
jgi:hypothetical protein